MNPEFGLSIVISSYNYGRYLAGAIESALGQRLRHVQVIVVDDGSTDGSRAVIEGFGDRIQRVYQANQGQVAACTAGIRLCRNDIVILLDSDDRLMPFAADEIRTAWTPRTVKVQYALQAIDAEDHEVHTVFPKYPHGLTPETIRAELFRAGVYPATTTSGTAFARRFLEQVMPIPDSYDCDIDDALNAVAPLYGDVVTVRKPLGHYRVHDCNTSAHAELSARRFERYARDSEERERYLRDNCRRLGLDLPPDVLRNDLAYWESKLAAAVLRPSARISLLPPTLRAAVGSILDPGQRMTHAVWATALALAPRPLARELLAQRFIFGRRSRLAEALLRQVWRVGRILPIPSRARRPADAGDPCPGQARGEQTGKRLGAA